MRTILRTAARFLTLLLWIVKGLLLVLAVGAAVMWPVSCGRFMAMRAARYTAGSASEEDLWYTAECWDGRAVLVGVWQDAEGGYGLKGILAKTASGGKGWRWQRWSEASDWDEGIWPSGWGPLRWDFTNVGDPNWRSQHCTVAAPLWLVSLTAGTWPVASIVLLIRRRRKRRRLARVGCCQSCGYDLRATAAAGGPLLPRCPECGVDAPAPRREED